MLPPWIASLFDGIVLERAEATELFKLIIEGAIDPILLAGILAAMRVRGESVAEIAGAVDAIRCSALPFDRPSYPLLDIVGTGGDGLNTINVSTTAALIAASAGAKTVKHGGRSASGKSGSSDVIARLGVDLEMAPETARRLLDEFGFCYLFAGHYHPSFRNAAPVRKGLPARTIFNLVGPLSNPARPDHIVLGVSSLRLVRPMAKVLLLLQVNRALVVHGSGLDEIALHGATQVAEISKGSITEYAISPSDFGLAHAPLSDVIGGSVDDNSRITADLLQGQGTAAQQNFVAINAGAALYVAGISQNFQQGAQLALTAMANAQPMRLLQQIVSADDVPAMSKEAAHA